MHLDPDWSGVHNSVEQQKALEQMRNAMQDMTTDEAARIGFGARHMEQAEDITSNAELLEATDEEVVLGDPTDLELKRLRKRMKAHSRLTSGGNKKHHKVNRKATNAKRKQKHKNKK